MQNLFIEFLPPWVETNLQPAFYDKESGTVLQLLARIYPKINDLIRSNNQLVKDFEELHDYVYDYFDNLDITEEVNAKLDEMAESGELAEIIAQYVELNGVLAYNTIADMAASENLVSGSTARVLGNNAATDGDGAYYLVRELLNTDVVDGFELVAIAAEPTLVAERIHDMPLETYVADNAINVKYNGAKGDGVTDDYEVLQALIDNNPHKTLYFPAGTYKISSTLAIKAGNDYQVNLAFDNNAILSASEEVSALLTVGEVAGGSYNRYQEGGQVNITGGQFDGSNVDGAVIKLNSAQQETRFIGGIIRHVQDGSIGLQINGSGSSGSIIQNAIIQGDGSEYTSTGMEINSDDNKITGVFIQKIKKGIIVKSGGNFIRNVHILGSWSANTVTSTMFNDTLGIEVQQEDQFLTDIYLDTVATGIKLSGSASILLKGLVWYFWVTPDNSVITLFDYKSVDARLKLSDAWLNVPTNANGTTYGVRTHSDDCERYFYFRKQLEIKNSHLQNLGALTTKTDLILDLDNDINPINYTPWSKTMTVNGYYILGYVYGKSELNIRMANDQMIRVVVNTDADSLTVTNIFSTNHVGKYYVALIEGENSQYNRPYRILAVKATEGSSGFNPVVNRLNPRWDDKFLTCPAIGGLNPMANPNVLSEASFNPV